MVEQEVMRGQLVSDGEVKVVAPSEREGRLSQVKRILSGALSNGNHCQQQHQHQQHHHHHAQPAPATPHQQQQSMACDEPTREEVKPRKRKERHESIGSITQERKVVRSNSEERPLEENDDGSQYMRRVSSHEDFKKSHPLHERNCSSNLITADIKNVNSPNRLSPHRDPKSDFIKDDDYEHEKRRSSERFSRPLAPRGRRSNFGRKRKTKVFMKTSYNKEENYYCKENDNIINANNNNDISVKLNDTKSADDVKKSDYERQDDIKSDLVSNFLQLHTTERERSPSPVNTPVAPALDLSTLHEQIDCSEPIPSSSNWGFTDNTETMPSQSVASVRMLLSPRNSIIMTRRIYMDTEVPMPTIGINNDPKNPLEQRLRQVSKQINSLKKKIKKFEEEFESHNGYRPSHIDKMEDKSIKKLCTELNKLRKEHKQLKDDPLSVMCTAVSKSNVSLDSMKSRVSQIKETLVEIEKRLVEKRVSCNRSEKLEELSGEALMDEKVAVQKALLHFEGIYGRPSSKEDRDLVRPLYDRYRTLKRMVARSGMTKLNASINELATIHEHETMDFVSLPTQTAEPEFEHASTICGSTDSDTDTSIGENLHALPLDELLEQQRITNEEKKRLRRSLKEYENEFQMKTGRKLQKDDRLPMEGLYLSYKQAKAKLRLLEALVAKHSQ